MKNKLWGGEIENNYIITLVRLIMSFTFHLEFLVNLFYANNGPKMLPSIPLRLLVWNGLLDYNLYIYERRRIVRLQLSLLSKLHHTHQGVGSGMSLQCAPFVFDSPLPCLSGPCVWVMCVPEENSSSGQYHQNILVRKTNKKNKVQAIASSQGVPSSLGYKSIDGTQPSIQTLQNHALSCFFFLFC